MITPYLAILVGTTAGLLPPSETHVGVAIR